MTSSLHIAIIGGGAAGFFAAIEAKRCNPDADITIFEKNNAMLAKVAITGGGRCNLTNSFALISLCPPGLSARAQAHEAAAETLLAHRCVRLV